MTGHFRGWNYGGVVGPADRNPHGFSVAEASKIIFGTSEDLLLKGPPKTRGPSLTLDANDMRSTSVEQLEAWKKISFVGDGGLIEVRVYSSIPLDEMLCLQAEATCMCSNCTYRHYLDGDFRRNSPWLSCGVTLDRVLSSQFLAALRTGAHQRLNDLSEIWHFEHTSISLDRPSVAMHIRRGDISKQSGGMFTDDEYYLDVLDVILASFPHADVHAFSSSVDLDEFSAFAARGVRVHIDGSPLGDWWHFAAADIFVMAKSTFSHVPAMLNRKCVVYQHHWRAPLANWLTLEGLSDSLPRCLRLSSSENGRNKMRQSQKPRRKRDIQRGNSLVHELL